MRVLNIGFDKTLVGGRGLGDAVARHRIYGEYLDSLDIIVYTHKKEKLGIFRISEKVTGYSTNSSSKLSFISDAFKIGRQIYEHHKFDIIVCQDPFVAALVGIRLRKYTNAKLQINFHGDFWRNSWWLKERWYNFLLLLLSKFTLPRADGIRVMSHGQKEKLIKAGIPESKIRVISTPVDFAKFENFSRSERLDGKKVILMVGRKDTVKDFKTLFQAVNSMYNQNPNIELWLVGNYTVKEAHDVGLRREVALKATGLGGVDSDLLPQYYYSSDVVVLSSLSESFGKVLVEANACGKPVVATATTGAQEIIQGGYNGFLVPIKDAKALAEKILLLLDNPELAKQMGENGRKLVKEKFGDNTRKIVEFWKELIGK